MDINRHNYEAYLLDLLEGRLSVEEQQDLKNFLLLNPDCGEELSEIEPWVLGSEKVSYRNIKLLKKEIPGPATILTEHNFDLFSIARMEGDLSEDQHLAHQTMVESDDRNTLLWKEWQRTQLQPERLIFKGKDKLKHRDGRKSRVLWMSVISAAAAIALVIVLVRMDNELPQKVLTEQTPVDTKVFMDEGVAEQAEEREMPAQQLEERDLVQIEKHTDEQVEEPAHQSNNRVMFSVKKEQDRPIEREAKMAVEPVDDIQARSLRIAESHLSSSTPVEPPVSDHIEPLYIPPVKVHLSSLTVAQISEIGLQEMLEDYAKEKDISLWRVASAGIKGINKLAGSDISLLASRDEEGEMSGFQLKSKRFSLRRPLGQEE